MPRHIFDFMKGRYSLIEYIKAQKFDNDRLRVTRDLVLSGKEKVVSLNSDGFLMNSGSVSVPRVSGCVRTYSRFSIHIGVARMYHDLKQYYCWGGMKKDHL